MKKILTLLMMFFVGLTMWSANLTAVWPGTQALPGVLTYINNDTHIKIMVSSTNSYTNPIRVYANTTITIKADEGYALKNVTYEASSTGNYVTYAQNATVTPDVTPTVSGKNITWTFTNDPTEFTFKPSTQTRCNSITVEYATTGETPPQTYYSLTLPTGLTGGTVTANVNNPSQIASGTSVTVTATPNEGYELDYLKKDGVDVLNPHTFTISGNTTITAAFKETTVIPPSGDIQYEYVSYANVQDGDIVIIVDETSKNAMTNNNGTGTAPSVFPVTIQNGVITLEDDTNIKWVISVNNSTYKFNKQGTDTYLYCINDNNGVRVGTNPDNEFTIVNNFLFNNGKQRYVGVYNNQDWRCYTSINNNIKNCVVKLYKKITPDTPVVPEVNEIATLAELSDLNLNDTFVFTDTVTCVASAGKYLYVQDESGAALIYGDIDKIYVTTNVIPAGWNGKKSQYGGLPQITPISDFEDAMTDGQGNTIVRNLAPVVVKTNIAEVGNDLYKYCVITGAKLSATQPQNTPYLKEDPVVGDYLYITTNDGTLAAYTKTLGVEWMNDTENPFDFSKTYDVYGVLSVHNETPQILPMGVKSGGTVTSIEDVSTNDIKSIKYIDIMGRISEKPFEGINIVVKEYNDGTKTTSKIVN